MNSEIGISCQISYQPCVADIGLCRVLSRISYSLHLIYEIIPVSFSIHYSTKY